MSRGCQIPKNLKNGINVFSKRQKAPEFLGKGGHHLYSSEAIWPYNASSFDSGGPEARPTSHSLGPAGYRGCYALEATLKVEVVLIIYDLREIIDLRGFKSTQLLIL